MSASATDKSSRQLGAAIHAIALTAAMALIATEFSMIPAVKSSTANPLDHGSLNYVVTHLP